MNSNTRKAILKILLLKEEHTKKELTEAVEFISNNSEIDLFEYLSDNKRNLGIKKTPSKTIVDQTSKAVVELKDKDYEKYKLLKSFDLLVRKGELLPRMDVIKQLGAKFNKEFEAGKSRKEGIPKLMALLASVPIMELKNIITEITDESGKESSEYAELANYLIHGNANKTLNK